MRSRLSGLVADHSASSNGSERVRESASGPTVSGWPGIRTADQPLRVPSAGRSRYTSTSSTLSKDSGWDSVTLHHRIRRTVWDHHLPATRCPAYVVHGNAPDAPRASRHFSAAALPTFSAPFREIGDNYMLVNAQGETNPCETIRRPCSLLSSRRFRAVTERPRFRTSYGEEPAYK